MEDFQKKYECFQITSGLRDHLLLLSSDRFPLGQPRRCLVVETLVITNGERTVMNREEQDA